MSTTTRIATSIALTLALAASAAPAGARPFQLNANGSYVPAGSPSTRTASQPGLPPILPAANRSQRTALQQAQQRERLAYLAHHQPSNARYSGAQITAYGDALHTIAPSTVVHAVAHDGHFDWGDAGIGAAGALGLALLGLGAAFAISQHPRRSEGSPASTR